MDNMVTSNIAAIVMAAGFLFYLNKRDKLMQDMITLLGEKIDKLSDALNKVGERLTRIELEKRDKHGL